MAGKKDYSICFRLRRTNYEEAFVSVPVTDEVMHDIPDEHGHRRLDVEKLNEAAIRLGSDSQIRWRVEGKPIVELHPVQVAPNEDAGDPGKIH
jgi:hypothetical protein